MFQGFLGIPSVLSHPIRRQTSDNPDANRLPILNRSKVSIQGVDGMLDRQHTTSDQTASVV
jgi:hypothetical protein